MIFERLMAFARRFIVSEQGAAILAQHAGHAEAHDIALVLGLVAVSLVGWMWRRSANARGAAEDAPTEAGRPSARPTTEPTTEPTF